MLQGLDDVPLYIYYLIIISISLLNGLLIASKRALDTIDRTKLKEIYENDKENAKIANTMNIIKKPSKYNYANMVFNLISIILIFIVLNSCIIPDLNHKSSLIINAVLTLYLGIINIFFKKLAIQSSEKYAISLIRIQKLIYFITFPIVKFCLLISNLILLILRKDIDIDDNLYSEDEIMSILDKGQESGEIKEEGKKMIGSIFAFDDLLAYEIMTPRTDVFCIDLEDERESYIDQLMELKYSRIPVSNGDADNIIGILHIKDYLLKAGQIGFENINLKEILRPVFFVPETKNVESLFIEMQREKHHIAILIDEYGGFSGLISVEDIVEQIVGDIDDEFDDEERVISKIDDFTYVVDGNVYLDDLNEETGINLESETSETIGGFIIDIIGEIPKENAKYEPIEFLNYNFTILSIKDRRIERIKINIKPDEI